MLYAQCARDPVYWFNTFAWTVDPREAGEGSTAKMPMVLFPKQAELITWLQEREANRQGGLVEKSRDFGITWLCCGYAVHGWLFRPGVRFGFGSRKLEYVDNSKDAKTIFYKLRYIVENLPWWMRPKEYLSKYCLLDNHVNGSSISGEGGDSIGRGDRTTLYFVDESAFLEQPESVDRALSQTTNCQIDVSTPNGVGNTFYTKRHGGKIAVFRCHWRDDPRKNEAWYQAQKDKLGPVTVAQEIDIDYTASIEGICIPAAWVQAAVELHLKYALPETGSLRGSIDLAGGGANQNVLGFKRGIVLQSPVHNWRHESQSYTANTARDLCESVGAASLVYDNGGGYGGGMADMARNEERPPRLEVRAINNGDAASDSVWQESSDEAQGREPVRSSDKFINLRAECWYLLRERFRKTWEMVNGHKAYPLEELISIPNHTQLINDLSKPLVVPVTSGKIKIESKADMRRRGVASPDYGDMLAMFEAPESVLPWWADTNRINEMAATYAGQGQAAVR